MRVQTTQPYTPPRWATELRHIPGSRLPLAQTPTPLQPWEPPGISADVVLWIKRDDMTGITLSGNKARKLEFLLADAVERQCDTVITCGGIQSNHARATAIAAREHGLKAHLVLNSADPTTDPGLAGNLLLDRLVGANLHLITFKQYLERDRIMSELADELRQKGQTPYIVPEGGSNGLGSWGYMEAVRETLQQIDAQSLEITDIVHACGSGGTTAGLSLGLYLAGSPIRVHPVNVCWDPPHFYDRINAIFDQIGTDLLRPLPRAEELVDIIDGYVGLGYARSRAVELAVLAETSTRTGILLDPVYTGKAFYGLINELNENRDRFAGNRILFLHTGGLFGLYNQLDSLADVVSPWKP